MYLWKDRRLRLNLTRLGMEYLAAMVLVGLFAMNSGNNLLYLVFSFMLGLLLVSGWVSRAALQNISLDSLEEGNLFARVRGGIRVRLRDQRPQRVRGLEVRLELEEGRTEPGFYSGGQGAKEAPLVVLHTRVDRRGWCDLKGLELKTTYPFGFIEKSWRYPLEQKVLVLPHPRTSSQPSTLAGEARQSRSLPGDVSPEGARPYRRGDALSRVHWKRTAQRRSPWVRTFEGEEAHGLQLRLDLTLWAQGKDFERELERLSGAILQTRLQKRDVFLALLSVEGQRDFAGHRECWRALALATPQG
jgi:uncharacterized protein (DUF58 family)